MKITDKIITDAIKTSEDAYINSGFSELLDEKMKSYDSSGLESLISGPNSFFNQIKKFIGNYIGKYTNSLNVVEENKNQFFNKIEGLKKLPEDLK